MPFNQLPRSLKTGALLLIAIGVTMAVVIRESPTPEEAPAIGETGPSGELRTELPDSHDPVTGIAGDDLEHELPELPLAHTVEDIEVRGSIHIDRQGNLIRNQELRQFLEFFMGQTQSPEDEPAMRAHMTAVMEQKGIPAPVQQQVMATLDVYLDYRQAEEELAQRAESQQLDTVEIFREVRSLRRDHLGRELAEAFFGEDEARTETMLAQQRLMNNEHLDDTTREQLMRDLESDLPESTQQVRKRSRQVTDLSREVQRLRDQGASPDEIQAARREAVGHEAAERLAQVDRQRDQWEQRMEQYRQEKAALESNEGLSSEDRAEAISNLQEELFESEAERRRARALERIAESGEMDNSS